MKRFARRKMLLSALLVGGMLTQLGPCANGFFNGFLATIDFCAVLGPDCTLGPIAPCGDPTTRQDDLLLDCPAPVANNTGS